MEVFLIIAVLIFYVLALLGYAVLIFIVMETYKSMLSFIIVTTLVAIAYWTLISAIATWVFTPLT